MPKAKLWRARFRNTFPPKWTATTCYIYLERAVLPAKVPSSSSNFVSAEIHLQHGYRPIPRSLLSILLHSFVLYTPSWRLPASSNNLDNTINKTIGFTYIKVAPLQTCHFSLFATQLMSGCCIKSLTASSTERWQYLELSRAGHLSPKK